MMGSYNTKTDELVSDKWQKSANNNSGTKKNTSIKLKHGKAPSKNEIIQNYINTLERCFITDY